MTMEASDRLHGSTSTLSTRKGLQAYCGYIALLLADWLEAGHIPPTSQEKYQWAANHNNPNATVAGDKGAVGIDIGDGGKWVKTNSAKPITWRGWGSQGTAPGQNYIDFPIPHTGVLEVNVSGSILSQSTADFGGDVPDSSVEIYLAVAPTPVEGGNISPTSTTESQRRIRIPGSSAALGVIGADFHTRVLVRVPALGDNNLYRAQVYLRKLTAPAPSFVVSKIDMTFRAVPDTTIEPIARVNKTT